MKYLTSQIKSDIKWHALNEYPNECCGIIVFKKNEFSLMECDNVSEDKCNAFEISAKDYLRAKENGDVIAYYHSHPKDKVGKFSPSDKIISKGQGLPLILFSMGNDKFLEYSSQ